MEFLTNVVTSVVPLVVTPIIKHVTYPFKVGNNVRALESATNDLVALKMDVENSIENAERENGVPTNQVKEWLHQVEGIEKEAREILENYRQPRRCVFNLCPDIRSNYSISRRAVKKLVDVKSQNDKKANIQEITHQRPPLAQEMPVSLAKSGHLDLALRHIRDDAHAVIGIWGMGGVGKTHLLKQINNVLSKDHVFDVVLFVTCSKECSEAKVQDAIVKKLKLENANNMEGKADKIYNFLRQRSFVLLLDDLWNRVDLEKVGIPTISVVDGCKRKTILTTRSEEVCRQMEVKKKIKVDVLKPDQSWSLFKEKVTEETIKSHPLIEGYAKMVMEELGGLPLALITVGRAMHGREDPSEWDHTIEQLKEARLHDVELSSTDESVFHILKFSYDNLKTDTLKECFLLCSLWPEDYWIEKGALVGLWMGLGLIDESEIQRAYNVGYDHIRRLQAACLLETIDNVVHVKMHDVIRDMALWIASNQGVEKNRWIVQAGTSKSSTEIEVWGETEKLSLMFNNTHTLSFHTNCTSTNLSTLLLNGNWLNDVNSLRLDLFFQLTVLNLIFNSLTEFPIEICKLVNLRYLNLSYNKIESLPKELEALINLKYMLLRANKICSIPYGIVSKLKALRVLDLYYNQISWEFIPLLLEELQCLREFQALGIFICTDMLQFEKLIEAINVPTRWLQVSTQHERSSFSFSSSFFGNYKLSRNLFQLTIKKMGVEWVQFESSCGNSCHFERLDHLRFSEMDSMKEILWKGVEPKDVLPRLQTLEFKGCTQLRSISWVVYVPCIQIIGVHDCGNIKQLIYRDDINNSEFEATQHSFPSLQRLQLFELDALESICDPKITFPTLEGLAVHGCPKLKKLPFETDNMPRKLKAIVGEEEWWNGIQWEDTSLKSSLQPIFQKLPY